MTRKEILEYLTPKFIQELDKITNMYKLIGISGDFARQHGIGSITYDESPMWLQFNGGNDDNTAVVFKCSLSNVGFEIPLEENDIMLLSYSGGGHSEVYDYFKKLKYEHIRDNHPTVWNEQEFHISRINHFLSNYEGL